MHTASTALPEELYTAAAVRELDRIAIEQGKIAGSELMERAGRAAFAALLERWPGAVRIVVLCGGGNNGGDGYVLARLALEAGLAVDIVQVGDSARLRGDAKTAALKCRERGLEAQDYRAELLTQADVVVDALLGTGFSGELAEDWQGLVRDLKRFAPAILSIDIPSGLHADTGRAMPVAVEAALTITFIAMKRGLLTADGPSCCGELRFASLDVPASVYAAVPASARRIELSTVRHLLAPRRRDTHKGQCGHVLIIGGDYGYAGAVRMAGEAALRTGAGLVTVATRPEHALALPLARPELMTHALHRASDLEAALGKASVVVIGPGLGQSTWGGALFARVLQSPLPMVVDADALNLLASEPQVSANWILTPHPGEAARLLGNSSRDIQADRFAAALQIQARYAGVCVLKGSGTLVVGADQSISLCSSGNPGMASGGMGDVLCGVIAALLAQGSALDDAARVGVCLHAAAADRAALGGERGLLASDVLAGLRELANP